MYPRAGRNRRFGNLAAEFELPMKSSPAAIPACRLSGRVTLAGAVGHNQDASSSENALQGYGDPYTLVKLALGKRRYCCSASGRQARRSAGDAAKQSSLGRDAVSRPREPAGYIHHGYPTHQEIMAGTAYD